MILTKEIELSTDQQAAKEAMLEWIYRPVEKIEDCFFSLTGSAGTGKTTLIKSFIDDLGFPFRDRICVSAPTHKAKKVISIKSGCPEVNTVQALIGLKPDLDLAEFDVNNPSFSPSSQKLMNNYKLIAIDEASMVNSDLYKVITEEAGIRKIKILFIGDLKQLPPIKEPLSHTLSKPVNKYNLTQIVRQEEGNPLIELLDCLRADIDSAIKDENGVLISGGTENYKELLKVSQGNNKGEGYEVLNNSALVAEKITDYFTRASSMEDKNYVRVIAWTNDCIKQANNFIRNKSFKYETPLVLNESLLSYKTISDEDGYIILTNSEDYVVESMEEKTDWYGIRVWVSKLKCIDTDSKTEMKVVIPSPDNYEKYINERQELLSTALAKRGKAWKAYYAFRNSYCLLETLMEGKTVIDTKDVDYGYGITIHKSQGSTFNSVFVQGRDIEKMAIYAQNAYTQRRTTKEAYEQAKLDCKKLWYVALSRASKKAYIII